MKRIAATVILGFTASCVADPPAHVYEAEFGAAKVDLIWKHREQGRFETLSLVCEPGRVNEDLPIDGSVVVADYQHGGRDQCAFVHRVTGTLRLLEHRATQVRARVDAVARCPEADPVAVKGEFDFDVKPSR